MADEKAVADESIRRGLPARNLHLSRCPNFRIPSGPGNSPACRSSNSQSQEEDDDDQRPPPGSSAGVCFNPAPVRARRLNRTISINR